MPGPPPQLPASPRQPSPCWPSSSWASPAASPGEKCSAGTLTKNSSPDAAAGHCWPCWSGSLPDCSLKPAVTRGSRRLAPTPQHRRPPLQLSRSPTTVDDNLYTSITQAQIDAITYHTLPADTSTITPVAKSLKRARRRRQGAPRRVPQTTRRLAARPRPFASRRVRNLLDAASIADIAIDPYEGYDTYVIFEKLRAEIRRDDLINILAWLTLHPADDHPITTVPELGIHGEAHPRTNTGTRGSVCRQTIGKNFGKNPRRPDGSVAFRQVALPLSFRGFLKRALLPPRQRMQPLLLHLGEDCINARLLRLVFKRTLPCRRQPRFFTFFFFGAAVPVRPSGSSHAAERS